MITIGQEYRFGEHTYTITKNLLAEPHHSHAVYLVSDQAGNYAVAKFVTTTLAVDQIKHEQQILQELSHLAGVPHTKVLVELHDSANPHFLAAHLTKYIPHKYTLTHYLQFRPTLLAQVKLLPLIIEWFKQCVDLMTIVHDQGIAHGDLKLQNCVLGPQGVVYIIDWDHGHWLTQRERPPTIEGTPPYMSPEHLQGQAPDIQTDIYTLGMMFLALTYGSVLTPLYTAPRPQAQRREKTAVVKAIMQGETAKYHLLPLPRTPLEMNLQMIWRRMTAPQRAERFSDMHQIKDLLVTKVV